MAQINVTAYYISMSTIMTGPLFFRWRVLLTTMMLNAKNSATVTHTCAILHNFLSLRNHKYYLADVAKQTAAQAPDPVWHDLNTMAELQRHRGRRTRDEAKVLRDYLKDYYSSNAGKVPWQDVTVLRHVSLKLTNTNWFLRTDGRTDGWTHIYMFNVAKYKWTF